MTFFSTLSDAAESTRLTASESMALLGTLGQLGCDQIAHTRTLTFLPGGGEMAGLIRNYDWTVSSLGDPATWPHSLKTLVDVMLRGNQPTHIVWGPERILLYNDSYVPLLGKRHPSALGRPFLEVYTNSH